MISQRIKVGIINLIKVAVEKIKDCANEGVQVLETAKEPQTQTIVLLPY